MSIKVNCPAGENVSYEITDDRVPLLNLRLKESWDGEVIWLYYERTEYPFTRQSAPIPKEMIEELISILSSDLLK